jgi:dihydroflavonol-4-reductase
MRALVTGATGLVGGQVCRVLAGRGDEVRAGVRAGVRVGPPGLLDSLGVEPVRIDLDDTATLSSAMDGVDTVFHCAAIYSYERTAEVERVNVAGTANVIAAAARVGVRRVVVTSSSVTCGSSAQPVAVNEDGVIGAEYTPPYFASKVQQERTALAAGRAHGVEVVLACPAVVLGGPTSRLVPSNAIVLRYLLDPWRATFPGGSNLVRAVDVAAGHVVLAEHGEPGRRYLLGGENLTWREIHATIGELAGVGGPGADLPTTAAYLASLAAEGWAKLTGSTPISSRDEALTIGRYFWYSDERARELGYVSGTASGAVAAALAWLLTEQRVPAWLRGWLHVTEEVRAARPLVPRLL